MSNFLKHVFRPAFVGAVLFFSSLVYYANAAVNFPTLFSLDNHLNHAATRYLAEHHRIPVVSANDPDIVFSEIGTTRSLRPPFTFIVSAVVSKMVDGWVDTDIRGQRLGASLIGAMTVLVIFVGFYMAFNHIGLAFLGAAAIGLMPKFVFLASCNNDDIGAIFSTSLLFSSVLALIRYKDKTWVLIALAISFGFVLQSKYTAWLILPWLGMFAMFLLKPVWVRVVRLLPLLMLITVMTGGWWVVFNMINYGLDDPSALRHSAQLQVELSESEPRKSNQNLHGYAAAGVGVFELLTNHDQFLSKSVKSFVGYLEWLELEMGAGAYLFYGGLFLIGIIGAVFRSWASHKVLHYFDLVVLVLIVSQCLFYLHHNLFRDIQPQARYVLPVIMPIMYLFLRGLAQLPSRAITLTFNHREVGLRTIVSAGLLAACVLLHIVTFMLYVTPTYKAQRFFTNVSAPKHVDLEESFDIVSSSDISYQYVNAELALQRTGNETPTIMLTPRFCQLLPMNALISLNVTSMSMGGLYLRLDRKNQDRYDNMVWRSFPAGSSVIIFSIDAEDCTGAKITLAKRTNRLTLSKLQISELKVHHHGKPI